MKTQMERAQTFRALHQRDHAFLIPNPWDLGTARLLAGMGFAALATTSAGFAFSVGKRDNTVDRLPMMRHLTELAAATDLPVSADLGNGFGDDPETVAESIRLAAAAGAVGCSIEDATGRPDRPFYDHMQALERIQAAVEAARALPFPFTLTARAENYLYGKPDLLDSIKRLQLYQSAGADVLYAPGMVSRDEIADVVTALDRPVNVLAGLPGFALNLEELSALGVKRVSVGSALCRAAVGAFLRGATEMKERGTFTFAQEAVSSLSNLL